MGNVSGSGTGAGPADGAGVGAGAGAGAGVGAGADKVPMKFSVTDESSAEPDPANASMFFTTSSDVPDVDALAVSEPSVEAVSGWPPTVSFTDANAPLPAALAAMVRLVEEIVSPSLDAAVKERLLSARAPADGADQSPEKVIPTPP